MRWETLVEMEGKHERVPGSGGDRKGEAGWEKALAKAGKGRKIIFTERDADVDRFSGRLAPRNLIGCLGLSLIRFRLV